MAQLPVTKYAHVTIDVSAYRPIVDAFLSDLNAFPIPGETVLVSEATLLGRVLYVAPGVNPAILPGAIISWNANNNDLFLLQDNSYIEIADSKFIEQITPPPDPET